MSDAEAALLAHLDGKFFWEPTTHPEEPSTSRNVIEIRRAQRKFAGNAKQITSRTCEPVKPVWNPGKYSLTEDQKPLEKMILAISEAYGIFVRELVGFSKEYRLQPAKRHLYWALMKYVPEMSYSQAGRILSRNHTSIIHGIEVFEAKYDVEKVAEVEHLMGLV